MRVFVLRDSRRKLTKQNLEAASSSELKNLDARLQPMRGQGKG